MPAATPTFTTRYRAGELASFFELAPGDVAGSLQRRLDRPRSDLASALRGEALRLGAPPEVLTSIDRLSHPESRVVVTGQQPGLLLGPAYTLSKAVCALRLAADLDRDDAPVVPVFWVAGQDHDTEEVDHAWLLDGEERLHRLSLPLPEGVPSGRIPFHGDWLELLKDGLEGTGARPEHLDEVVQLLEEAYGVAESFADTFGAILYRLLGRQGIIVLDPTRPTLAPFFRGILERELADPRASVEAIVAAGAKLRALGLEPQLGRGRDATNLFLEEEVDGLPRRALLRFDGKSFSTPRRGYSRAELEGMLCDEPWRVTPAAGLRPVTQDAVLPTAAFVVGPGELRYLAQLRGVYTHHRVQMPLAWPRATSVVIEPPVRRILARHGLDYDTFSSERRAALERILLERSGHDALFIQTLERLERDSATLHEHVRAIDPTLGGAVDRGISRVESSIELLRRKAAAALVRQDATTRRQFDRLEAHLFPNGVEQERFLSPFSFFLKFGCKPMIASYLGMGASGEHLLRP